MANTDTSQHAQGKLHWRGECGRLRHSSFISHSAHSSQNLPVGGSSTATSVRRAMWKGRNYNPARLAIFRKLSGETNVFLPAMVCPLFTCCPATVGCDPPSPLLFTRVRD